MNLWTIPASDEQSLININRSLSAPVAPDTLSKLGLASPLFALRCSPMSRQFYG
jgi:hypothetical protein